MDRFFWLICGLFCGVFNAIFVWRGLRKYVAAGEYTPDEAQRFARGIALWIAIPSVVLWTLQMSVSPEATPFYLYWPNPQRAFALFVQVFLWVALVYWVFLGTGAVTLFKYLTAKSRFPTFFRRPVSIKIAAIVVVAAGVAALLGQHA